jgi:hypothetical protein
MVLQNLLDRLFVFGHIIAARLLATLPAFQVVGGIDGPALRTGVVSPYFLKPVFIAGVPDPLQVVPKLYPMGSFRLKLFQITAWILRAFYTKIDSPFSGAGKHFACLAIRPSLGRPASVTLHNFL